MSHAPRSDDELLDLLAGYCNGQLADDEAVRLAEWLRDEEDARTAYIRYMDIHSTLRWNRAPLPVMPDEESSEKSSLLSPRAKSLLDRASQHPLISSTGVAMVVVLAFVVGLAFTPVKQRVAGNRKGAETQQPETSASSDYVAKLSNWQSDKWLEGTRPPRKDPRLKIGQRLVLESGLIEVTYLTGARVVIEGPAEFVVGRAKGEGNGQHVIGGSQANDDVAFVLPSPHNSGFLERGKLVARVEGKGAQGFTIETANARIEDLGTEFGVEVDERGAAEFVVLSGKVDVVCDSDDGSEQRVQIVKGEGAFVAARGARITKRKKVDAQFVVAMRRRLNAIRAESTTLRISYQSSPTPPTIDAHDIANLGDAGPHDLPYAKDEENWILGLDRPGQGQTFTTASHRLGYALTAVTVQRNGDSQSSYQHPDAGVSICYRLRIVKVSGGVLESVLLDEKVDVLNVTSNQPGFNLFEDPQPLEFVTFSGFELKLEPNSTYAFELIVPHGISLGWELNRTGDHYAGGSAFSDGAKGDFGNSLNMIRDADRVFHVDLQAVMSRPQEAYDTATDRKEASDTSPP
ncbi:MAG: FecR family protein [Pirellulales bacterium]|nr:FecR family protein [Pirellulales bacterium]